MAYGGSFHDQGASEELIERLREYVALLPAAARPAILALAADLPPLYVDRLREAIEALDDAVTAEVAWECEQVL